MANDFVDNRLNRLLTQRQPFHQRLVDNNVPASDRVEVNPLEQILGPLIEPSNRYGMPYDNVKTDDPLHNAINHGVMKDDLITSNDEMAEYRVGKQMRNGEAFDIDNSDNPFYKPMNDPDAELKQIIYNILHPPTRR